MEAMASTVVRRSMIGAVVVTGAAQFMAALDNLVVTMALPVIKAHLHAGLAGLEWTVNAYTLTFAVLLLTGAALGERFGRRRMFVAGIALFTISSAAAALAPSISMLIVARALEGAGAALIVPLSLTLLADAVPPERRNLMLGIWGGLSGLAVAIGPLVGGAVVEGLSWQFIFWLNVPIGIVLAPAARRVLRESRGPQARLDVRGVVLASFGLLGVVYGLVRGPQVGWTNPEILTAFATGIVLLVGFIVNERRVPAPMLPLRLFRSRQFSLLNIAAFLMSFGMFGSVFLLAQFLQIVQHYSPLAAGVRTLPWTAMPVLIAPAAGLLVERVGARRVLVTGLTLQAVGLAYFALRLHAGVAYLSVVPAFIFSGIGMALFFVPVASLVLASVPRAMEGVASGTNNATRELGGVFGVAVLGAVFAGFGSYASPADFVDGIVPALAIGAALVGLGAVATLGLRGRASELASQTTAREPLDGVGEQVLATTSA
jgi:EmrB/QacA subfamily drug resistance transporter